MPADPFRFMFLRCRSLQFHIMSDDFPAFPSQRFWAPVPSSPVLSFASVCMPFPALVFAQVGKSFPAPCPSDLRHSSAIPVQTTQIPIETFLSFAIPRPLQPFRCYSVSKPCFPNPLLRSVARRNSGSSPSTCLRCFSVSTPFNAIPVRCACRLFISFSPRTKRCYSVASLRLSVPCCSVALRRSAIPSPWVSLHSCSVAVPLYSSPFVSFSDDRIANPFRFAAAVIVLDQRTSVPSQSLHHSAPPVLIDCTHILSASGLAYAMQYRFGFGHRLSVRFLFCPCAWDHIYSFSSEIYPMQFPIISKR